MRGRERGGEETEKERVGQGIQGKMKKKKIWKNESYVYEKMIIWAYMQQFFFKEIY